jgi:hypothetical protein
MSSEIVLPSEFAALQPFVHWALPTETARNHHRHESTAAEIEAFAAAMLANFDAIVARLNEFPLDEMPENWRPLYWMLLSLAEVAPAVEFYHGPQVPDGYDTHRFVADENFPLRPRM